jgi:hypothetical protein
MQGPVWNTQMYDIYSYLWDACKQVGGGRRVWMTMTIISWASLIYESTANGI